MTCNHWKWNAVIGRSKWKSGVWPPNKLLSPPFASVGEGSALKTQYIVDYIAVIFLAGNGEPRKCMVSPTTHPISAPTCPKVTHGQKNGKIVWILGIFFLSAGLTRYWRGGEVGVYKKTFWFRKHAFCTLWWLRYGLFCFLGERCPALWLQYRKSRYCNHNFLSFWPFWFHLSSPISISPFFALFWKKMGGF